MSTDDNEIWWLAKRETLLAIAADNLNAYVYDLDTIKRAAGEMLSLEAVDRVLYAVKANYNADILRALAATGANFDCVSVGEIKHLFEAVPGIDPQRILFTPNFAPRQEYEWALARNVPLTLDSLYPLQHWPDLFTDQEILVRLDPGKGAGHHDKVKTAGKQSKFGVSRSETEALAELIEKVGATVVGIHAHSGSGILDPAKWHSVAETLVNVAARFPDASVLDLGGGIGVPETRDDDPFDLKALNARLLTFRSEHPGYEIWLEPGRYLVAQAGVLLAHVTQVKQKGDQRYLGISTGLNSLIRPALYDAYHEIVNLSRIAEAHTDNVSVVGPICETGDSFGSDHPLPGSTENDVMLIANVGAYGQVMSSRYNLRETPPEIAI